MLTVARSASALAALALLLTACGGTDGDVTGAEPTEDAGSPSAAPSPDPSEPEADESPSPDEPTAAEKTPTRPPDDGSDEDSGGTTAPPDTGESGSAGEPATELTVRLDPGNGDVSEWTVTCDPVGGTAGDPEAACETLDSITPRDVAPVPPDTPCTQQYGGPQTATVTGRWDGTKVDLSFSRENGCEIRRWDAMEPVLPAGERAEL